MELEDGLEVADITFHVHPSPNYIGLYCPEYPQVLSASAMGKLTVHIVIVHLQERRRVGGVEVCVEVAAKMMHCSEAVRQQQCLSEEGGAVQLTFDMSDLSECHTLDIFAYPAVPGTALASSRLLISVSDSARAEMAAMMAEKERKEKTASTSSSSAAAAAAASSPKMEESQVVSSSTLSPPSLQQVAGAGGENGSKGKEPGIYSSLFPRLA